MEIKEVGYQDIRDFIEATWIYVELRSPEGVPVMPRLSVSDPRVSWTHEEGDRVLELTVDLHGSDNDISIPCTFGGSALFRHSFGGDVRSEESFTQFTMEAIEDQLIVKHQVQVPELPKE